MSLFDEQNFAEIGHPDYPGERLVACRNPALADRRARKRAELLAATEKPLAPILAPVQAGRLTGADKIGLARRQGPRQAQDRPNTSSSRSPTPPWPSPATSTTSTPKQLSTASTCCAAPSPATSWTRRRGRRRLQEPRNVEKDFRPSRPSTSTCAPCTTAWKTASKPTCSSASSPRTSPGTSAGPGTELTYTDENPPTRTDPVAPATRSQAAPRPRPPASTTNTATPAQLPRAARPPGHPHPQRRTVRRSHGHRPNPRRTHPRPTPSLRTDRRPHPAHLEVVRTLTRQHHKRPGQPRKPFSNRSQLRIS